jgi:hypothetical protein
MVNKVHHRAEIVQPLSAILLCILISMIALFNRFSVPSVARGWVGSQYFVNYDKGFVRRGFPGQLLDISMGSATYEKIEIFGRVMSILAIVAVGYVVWILVKDQNVSETRLWILLIALFGPLSIGILLRDIGRYDTFGYIYFGILVLTAKIIQKYPSFSYLWAPILIFGLVLVTLTQEYLLAFCVIPTIIFTKNILQSQYPRTNLWKKLLFVLICTMPIAIAAIFSVTRTPSSLQIAYFHERAGTSGKWNAIQSLALDISGQRNLVTPDLTRHSLTNLFYLALFLFFSSLVMNYISTSKLTKITVISLSVVSGLLVSNLGVDLRRPWSLAMWATIASAALIQIHSKQIHPLAELNRGKTTPSRSQTSRIWRLQIALYLCIFCQAIPNTPINVWGITYQLNDIRSFYHSIIDFADPELLGGR